MHFQPRFHVIALGAILACATPWFATRAVAQSLKLPQSTEAARSAWMEDCTTYRSQRDRLEQEQRDNAARREGARGMLLHYQYNKSTYQGYLDQQTGWNNGARATEKYEYDHERSVLTAGQPTPENQAKLAKLSKEFAVKIAAIDQRQWDAVASYQPKIDEANRWIPVYEKELSELDFKDSLYPQQIQAAQQAFDDCTKRQATARNEITPLDDQVMTLLTALILQGSLDQWGETVIEDITKEEEKKKRREDAVRRIRQKVTGGGGHDPTASMILESGIELGVGAAIKAGTRKDRRITPPVDGGGTPSKGGCTGGACPR